MNLFYLFLYYYFIFLIMKDYNMLILTHTAVLKTVVYKKVSL